MIGNKIKLEKATEEDLQLFREAEKEREERAKRLKIVYCPTCRQPMFVVGKVKNDDK